MLLLRLVQLLSVFRQVFLVLTPVIAAVPWLAFLPLSSTPCFHCSCHPLPPRLLAPPPSSPLPLPPRRRPRVEEPLSFVPSFPWQASPGWKWQTSVVGPCVLSSVGCSAHPLAGCPRPTGLRTLPLQSCWPPPSCVRALACCPGRRWR